MAAQDFCCFCPRHSSSSGLAPFDSEKAQGCLWPRTSAGTNAFLHSWAVLMIHTVSCHERRNDISNCTCVGHDLSSAWHPSWDFSDDVQFLQSPPGKGTEHLFKTMGQTPFQVYTRCSNSLLLCTHTAVCSCYTLSIFKYYSTVICKSQQLCSVRFAQRCISLTVSNKQISRLSVRLYK